jgi:hypothetical protein
LQDGLRFAAVLPIPLGLLLLHIRFLLLFLLHICLHLDPRLVLIASASDATEVGRSMAEVAASSAGLGGALGCGRHHRDVLERG